MAFSLGSAEAMPAVAPAPRASAGCLKNNFFAGRFPGVVQGRAVGVIPSPSAKPLFPRRRRILTGGEPVFSDGLFGLRLVMPRRGLRPARAEGPPLPTRPPEQPSSPLCRAVRMRTDCGSNKTRAG